MKSRFPSCTSLLLQCLLCGMMLIGRGECSHAQDKDDKSQAGQRWAVIFVGLPGDEEHQPLFKQTSEAWHKWLVESLHFPSEHVLLYPSPGTNKEVGAMALTAQTLRSALDELRQKLQPNDTLWVFTLGHGHYDGKRAWFHVAGRDPSDEDFGRWLSDIKCREQVIWLTHSSSGWFVKPLSRPGRIVIAATAADDESNETEFPHALAKVAQMPREKMDVTQDQKVSIAELFAAVLQRVQERFQSDKRLPTEHAQLDDNGDGKGSEKIELKPMADDANTESTAPKMKVDGELARKTLLPD